MQISVVDMQNLVCPNSINRFVFLNAHNLSRRGVAKGTFVIVRRSKKGKEDKYMKNGKCSKSVGREWIEDQSVGITM